MQPGSSVDERNRDVSSTSSRKGANSARGIPTFLDVLLQLTFFDSPGNKAHEKQEADVSCTDNSPPPQNPLSVYNDKYQGNSSYDEK